MRDEEGEVPADYYFFACDREVDEEVSSYFNLFIIIIIIIPIIF